jgi:hypothetical protein
MSGSLCWCFTLNNPTSKKDFWGISPLSVVKYAIWQMEISPSTNTPHMQGYVELHKKSRLAVMKKLIPTAHWEQRKGSRLAARNYCQKEESRMALDHEYLAQDDDATSGPWELGEWLEKKGAGFRSDLAEAKVLLEEVKSGNTTMDKIRSENADIWMRWNSPMKKWLAEEQVYVRKERTKFLILFGKPGTGKSSYAKLKWPGAYYKEPGMWWDNYCGQKVVICEEFNSTFFSINELKRLADNGILQLPVKNAFISFTAELMVLISNDVSVRDWYKSVSDDHVAAVERRIDGILRFRFIEKDEFEEKELRWKKGVEPVSGWAPKRIVQVSTQLYNVGFGGTKGPSYTKYFCVARLAMVARGLLTPIDTIKEVEVLLNTSGELDRVEQAEIRVENHDSSDIQETGIPQTPRSSRALKRKRMRQE